VMMMTSMKRILLRMCDQPELSHNQCKSRVGVDLVETGSGNMYNELGHNQCLLGTGFGNKTGLEEESHTHSTQNIPTQKMMEKPQQRKKVW
jgi:hypothetical protein